MIRVVAYVRPDGKSPYRQWFDKLGAAAAAKVKRATDRMEEGNLGDHKSVGGGVLERRIDFGPGYRLYFGRDGQKLIVLVGGGTKARQQQDIQAAQAAWKAYQMSKGE